MLAKKRKTTCCGHNTDYLGGPHGMKKTRIISIILAMLMLVSSLVLAGCSGEGEEGEDKKASASTSTRDIVALNMYILTEDTTTDEAADRVQMALNEILLPNYKTLLKINYLCIAINL